MTTPASFTDSPIGPVPVPVGALSLVAGTSVTGFPLQITPAGLTATAVASGGTFAPATYFWKITFVTAQGESPAGNEASAAIVASGSCNLTWTAPPPNVTAVNVYRGTVAGAENALIVTLGAVSAYTDTGSAGTAGSPPATSSTPTIISWTAPADGQLHQAIVFLSQSVTSAETGGAVNVSNTLPDGTVSNIAGALGANHGTGAFIGGSSGGYQLTVGSGRTVSITQASALTAGASVVWARIWAS